jgi:hypothetical protein
MRRLLPTLARLILKQIKRLQSILFSATLWLAVDQCGERRPS